MSKDKRQETLLGVVKAFAQAHASQQYVLVPVDDFAVYRMLTNEIANTVASDASKDLIILTDTLTAHHLDSVDQARLVARRTFVWGGMPHMWADDTRVLALPFDESVRSADRFLVVISGSISFAVVGEATLDPGTHLDAFEGAWTGQRTYVRHIANHLLACASAPNGIDNLLDGGCETAECSVGCSMRLMAVLSRQLAIRQRDIAMEKSDLSSVLEILKAISAKRRMHDILFVFVEQIAKAVKVDRCSVVRVWGGEDRGYVRASHEDESVSDLAIDLRKYPEILRAMEVRGKVVFNDVLHEPLLRPFHEDLRRARVRSLMVIPIVLFDQNVGSLFLRAARTNSGFTLREVNFCEIVAEAAANALERATLFEGIQKANERLEHLAVTDGLTGVYNHRHFRERLEDEFQRAKRYNLPLAVMILDIDNFKRVNDTFGHLQGDSVLREVAARTQQSVRKSDIVARYGGEEFVVIMPQTSQSQSSPQAERLLHEISDRPFSGMPPGQSVTVSIGVAGLAHDSMNDCEDLIRVADAALYKAKHEGKNRVIMGTL